VLEVLLFIGDIFVYNPIGEFPLAKELITSTLRLLKFNSAEDYKNFLFTALISFMTGEFEKLFLSSADTLSLSSSKFSFQFLLFPFAFLEIPKFGALRLLILEVGKVLTILIGLICWIPPFWIRLTMPTSLKF